MALHKLGEGRLSAAMTTPHYSCHDGCVNVYVEQWVDDTSDGGGGGGMLCVWLQWCIDAASHRIWPNKGFVFHKWRRRSLDSDGLG